MTREIKPPLSANIGSKVAVLSPSWSAPAYFPAMHEQAMERIERMRGVELVEHPTTRKMGETPEARPADVNAALADPEIRAIFTTIGGDDQIRVTPHLDPELAKADPKPFFGFSDNTNILNWLWHHGVGSYHGGSTQIHFGQGHLVDSEHLLTLRAALFGGGDYVLPDTRDSEDFGLDWSDPRSLTEDVERGPAFPVEFVGRDQIVRGRTWGGCLEVLDQLAFADRLPSAEELDGAILIFETSELLPPADYVGRWIRGMGERGYLEAAAGLMFARPVVQDRDAPAPDEVVAARHNAYADYLLSNVSLYRNDLLVAQPVPFGHTRPQVILPYGGEITLDPIGQSILLHYPGESQIVRRTR